MRKFIIFFAFTALFFLSCSVDSEENDSSGYIINSSSMGFSSSNQIIYNPDMGFYSAETITVQTDGSINQSSARKATLLDKNGNFNEDATFNLVHLKIDISPCKNISNLTLNKIDSLLSNLEQAEQTAVIRFAYDEGYDGNKSNVEPEDFSTILNHIEQICTLVKKHTKVLTALECGMLGPWGEMHTTPFAENAMPVKEFTDTLKKISPNITPYIAKGETEIQRGYIVLIMEKFLTCLNGTELPFLVRQPNFIYNYLKRLENHNFDGKSVPTAYIPNGKTKKLGIYNDGYLDGEGDSGTFRIGREKEISFLEPFTKHTPYGGELIGDYGLSESDEQLKNVHLSFINIGWNANVLGGLDKKTASYSQGMSIFKYILTYMGYRYVVKDSSIQQESDSAVKLNISLKNEGFAELPYHRKKSLKVYFVKKDQEVLEENAISVNASGFFTGEKTSISSTAKLPSNLESGEEYQVFLKICDSDGKYAVRLANEGIWNESLRANKIGAIKITK